MAANGITPRIPNRAQFRAKFVLLTAILMVILPEELGSVMPCGCGNDQSQGPPEGILQRSPKQQDISQFSSSKPGALASFLSKSHVKLFAISLHNNFVVQLSEWKVNSAVPDVLPVSPNNSNNPFFLFVLPIFFITTFDPEESLLLLERIHKK